MIKYVIRQQDWFKRRSPNGIKPNIQLLTIDDFQFIDNHLCVMYVTIDLLHIELSCRINQNDITKNWTAHGINNQGVSVLVDVIIEED